MLNSARGGEHRALRTLTRVLVERLGGLDAAAACTRVNRSRLAEYYAPQGDAFIPADVLADLEAVAEAPLVTAELARLAGCALLPLRSVAEEELARLLAELGQEVAQAFGAYAEALRAGRCPIQDRARLAAEVGDIVRVGQEILGALRVGPQAVAA